MTILRAYEWDRINFTDPKKTKEIADKMGITIDELNSISLYIWFFYINKPNAWLCERRFNCNFFVLKTFATTLATSDTLVGVVYKSSLI